MLAWALLASAVLSLAFVVLLTPTGSLPSPRWRWWAGAMVAAPAVWLASRSLLPRPLNAPFQPVANPFAVHVLVGPLTVVLAVALAGQGLGNDATATWTTSSAAPWPTGCSPCCWAAATPRWSLASASWMARRASSALGRGRCRSLAPGPLPSTSHR